MNYEKALWRASGVFAPDYPRQSSDGATIQQERTDRPAFVSALNETIHNGMPGYYSVYSFPRGHSTDGNIPNVDCIFIDLDISDDYDPKVGDTSFSAWRRDMSALLARVRMIASSIIDAGKADYIRASLSGHKGLHLYLDFPTISPNNGTFQQFKNGLSDYGDEVMNWLDDTAGGVNIEQWVDVDASDLGRLARHPNTINFGAKYDDQTRWCVPVTIEELADLTVESYLELTRSPRWPDGYSRTPSTTAGNKVVQAIRTATSSQSTSKSSKSSYDRQAVENYDPEENIEFADLDFLTANKPCIKAFRERDDAFDHSSSSHEMELNIIARFVEMGVPREVIHEYFEKIPNYDEEITNRQINKVIGRGYTEFNCESVADRAPQFCLGRECSVYQRYDDISL